MTEVTYRALSEAAVEEIAKLSELGVRPEDIVMVTTQDVFWAASAYEPFWCLNHNIQALAAAAKFCEYDVGVINEDTGTMFRAAIKGMRSFNGMKPGTLIVVSDEDKNGQAHIYSMEERGWLTTQFRDTGLTISFGYNHERVMASADAAAETVADMLMNELPFTPGVAAQAPEFDPESMFLNYQWVPSQFEHFQIPETPKARNISSVRIKSKKPVDAKPDTTAIDEFLGSFKVLKSAT